MLPPTFAYSYPHLPCYTGGVLYMRSCSMRGLRSHAWPPLPYVASARAPCTILLRVLLCAARLARHMAHSRSHDIYYRSRDLSPRLARRLFARPGLAVVGTGWLLPRCNAWCNAWCNRVRQRCCHVCCDVEPAYISVGCTSIATRESYLYKSRLPDGEMLETLEALAREYKDLTV